MLCPTCQTLLREETCARQRIDRCAECGGVWLDQGELGPVVRNYEFSDGSSPYVEATRRDYPCPKCDKLMDRREYAHDSGVFLQRCTGCQGHWIEGWQVRRLAEYVAGTPAFQRLSDTMRQQIESERRLHLLHSLVTSRLLSGAVAVAWAIVVVLNTGDINRIISVMTYMALPLACIWFSEEMGRITGMSFGLVRPRVSHTTPGIMVAVAGWLLLLLPVVVWMLL